MLRPERLESRAERVNDCTWGWVFACEPSQVPAARAAIQAALAGCPRRDDVVLVAGELTANSVVHSDSRHGGEFAIELYRHPGSIELQVHDGGARTVPRLPTAPADPLACPDSDGAPDDDAGEGGRGLLLVQAHADTWGHVADDNGCTVWATFTLSGPPGMFPHSDTDFPGPGGLAQPPEHVLRYLLGSN